MTQNVRFPTHRINRMKAAARLALLSGFALQAAAPSAFAVEDRSRWSIGIEAGRALPQSPSTFSKNYNDGTDFGVRIKQELSIDWALAGAFSSQSVKQKLDASQKITTQPITLMAFRSFFRGAYWNPYFAFAGGISRNKQTIFSVTNNWTKLTAAGGLGLEYTVNPMVTFGVEALYHYYKGYSKATKDIQMVTGAAVVSFYIPDSWIPDKPKKPLSIRDLPPAPPEPTEDPLKKQAQAELNKVRQDIFDKKIEAINFEQNKAVLLPSSYETLDIVGTILRRYPQFSIRIEGHTDSDGTPDTNMELSQARAEAVRNYLIQNFELMAEKITAEGLGQTRPVADNVTDEGKFRNRRVEFIINK